MLHKKSYKENQEKKSNNKLLKRHRTFNVIRESMHSVPKFSVHDSFKFESSKTVSHRIVEYNVRRLTKPGRYINKLTGICATF